MESCMTKPEIKKKPKPPKPPPKPAQVKQNYPELLEKPTPVIPPRATNTFQTNGNMIHGERKERQRGTPGVPPRPTDKEMKNATRYSRRVQADDTAQVHAHQQRPRSDRLPPPRQRPRETDTSEATSDDVDFRKANPPVLTVKVRRSQKEQTFTSYLPDDHEEEEKRDDPPSKQTPASKSAGLKGVMKGLQLKSAPKASSREPSPDPKDETGSEKETPREKKHPESRQDIGGLLAGMFRKTPRDRSTVKADSDSEQVEEEGEEDEKTSDQTRDKGGFFSGVLKKNNKPAEESPAQGNLSVPPQLSASSDSLTENKEKVNIFSAMFKRKPAEAAQTDEDQTCLLTDPSDSNDHLSDPSEEKGGFFSGILRKSPRPPPEAPAGPGAELSQSDSSASADSVSDNKEKAGLFSGLLKKTTKVPKEENLSAQKEVSVSADSLSDTTKTKEKGGAFAGMFKKASRPADGPNAEDEKQDDESSAGSEGSSEENTKEKGGIFSGIFKKPPKTTEASQPEEDASPDKELSASNENLSESKPERAGPFSGLRKKTPKASAEWTASQDGEAQRELSASNDSLSDAAKDRNIFSNIFKKPQKPAEGAAADNDLEQRREVSGSCENLCDTTQKEKKGGLAGLFKRSVSIENIFDEEKGGLFSGRLKKPKASGDEEAAEDKGARKELSASNDSLCENSKERSIFSGIFKKTPKAAAEEESTGGEDGKFSASCENLTEESTLKEKTGGLAAMFKKSPKPALRSVASKDPLTDAKEKSFSCDSLTGIGNENLSGDELSAGTDNLSDAASGSKEKKTGFAGIFKRTPKPIERQESVDMEPPEGGGLRRRRTIKKKRRVVSFRVKTTLPRMPKLTLSQTSEKMPVLEESLELQEMTPAQESTVEVQPVEMAAYPTEGNLLESDEESDGLMEWWNSVEGWAEWNETSNFQEEDEEMAIEEAADRVYMAARLFVRLFNQRGATLQQHILELLALADAADQFHKKTVSAAIGGGVASVAGSVATITGLILAPFTFGASIIVTAVGISVATAGSITSATANITDTVHSNMDRKKVERMILNYQEEIKDIRECLEFVQEGMDTLQEWDFEKFSESAGKKALNHNIKHVMKEGGRAGKALMINTDKLISTVQVLGAAGGVVKAAQAITVTTGVMSALFLALDVFFLAKDSHDLRKGAKTKFATKIREVCKDLQDGLLELNRVKTQLQKTMDGIEVEEYEEIEEVEVEVDDDLELDPKKLAELEQELDLLEEKLDKKVEEEQRSKETDGKSMREKMEEKSMKEKGEPEEEEEEEEKERGDRTVKGKMTEVETGGEEPAKDEVSKERQRGSKWEKETENRRTAGRERQTEEKDEEKDDGGREADGTTKTISERGSQRSLGKESETEGEKTRSHSSSHRRSEEERAVKTESKRRERDAEREDHVRRERREEKRGSRLEDDGQSRRRGSDREKERSRRGDRHRSSVLREDGLYI